MKTNFYFFIFPLLLLLLLQSCSSSGFHLRKPNKLSGAYEKIALEGIASESKFYTVLEKTIKDAGGRVVPIASTRTIIVINNLKEDKKIVAYTRKRIAREYMVYLHFDYQIKVADQKQKKHLIRLNKTLIYDSNFILGKVEEENRIHQSLHKEAARLILLRLRYSKQ